MLTRWQGVAVLAAAMCLTGAALHAQPADDVRKRTGIETGLAVVVGGDLATACALAEGGRMLVHVLAPDAGQVTALREGAQRRGLGGRVVVGALPGGYLPHPDRFANLLIADLDALAARAPRWQELMRILAVRGAAYLKRQGTWQSVPRPGDDRLDGWTHRFYDATGNAVSRDRVAGFPRAVQWQHGPAMEDGTADGRIVHVADGRAVAVDVGSGDLVCRDAGNGCLLWRAPLGLTLYEGLAVCGGRVYLYHDAQADERTRGRHRTGYGPLVAVDLATGRLVQTYEQSLRAGTALPVEFDSDGRKRREQPVPWFVVREDVIVQAYGPGLVVLDRASGERRWEWKLEGATWFSPVVVDRTVLAAEAVTPARRGRHDGSDHVRAVVAFELADGKVRWRNENVHPLRPLERKGERFESRAELKPISAAGGLVLLHASSYQFRSGGSVAVLDAADGREMWRVEFAPGELYTQGSQRAVLRSGEVIVLDGTGAYRYDARTGQALGPPLRAGGIRRNARPNGACTASRATVDWLICNAWLYVGPDGAPQACFGARGACGQGVVPAHGLLFVPPTPCDCGDYTRGWQALAPTVPGRPIPDDQRLTQGAGSEGIRNPHSSIGNDEWPTFLGDLQRRSRSAESLPEKLSVRWSVQATTLRRDPLDADRRYSERYLGALSAPVVGGGLVVAAAPETHQVVALDAGTGKPRWCVATGGKVDSPPTLAGGLAVFGCDDGTVSAVRLADGRLAWRFRAAPTDGVAMHHGHVASAWHIPGSVLVLGDRVLVVAGHHTDIGGLHCWALDLATGRPRARGVIEADQPNVVTNALTSVNADGKSFWLGGSGKSLLHLSADLKDLPVGGGRPGPAVLFDRNGTRLRYRTDLGRGGSTHGWKQAMRVAGRGRGLNGHRMVHAGEVAYGLIDPGERDRRSASVIWAVRRPGGNGAAASIWSRSWDDLGRKGSYGALVLAGGRLCAGGGARDGSAGFVQILDAATGKLLGTIDLPARVAECGLAVAGGCLYACCEDGHVVCLGAVAEGGS
ncbi:MAG TPA: PQQ-binding-like beta-propeller repeat protein [Phycisphaerae bacterium]|nr:PQQ-binding-like beta-propeller repeat protein [Phycisphaerae bacterium]